MFRPPCVLHVVDNQWAISTHRNVSTGGTTFAARADAYREITRESVVTLPVPSQALPPF